MSSFPLEDLNNAIVRMDFVARGMRPSGVTKQATELGEQWAKFWERERSAFEVLDTANAARFWNRYQVCYAMFPLEVRAQLVAPSDVDVSLAKLTKAQVIRAVDANEAAAGAAVKVADGAMDRVTKLALLAVVVLLAYGYAKR